MGQFGLQNTIDLIALIGQYVTNAGFNDAISAGKRARAKRNVEKFEGRRLRQIIEIKVMDRVAAKVRSAKLFLSTV